MRHSGQARGQSIVEMAFILPILLVVIFGIIEFGWLIFAYSTISQAARNGAEAAAQLPPYQSWIDLQYASPRPEGYAYRNDDCINAVLSAIETDLTIIGTGANDQEPVTNYVSISYPQGPGSRNLDSRGPIEVTITYPVRGLTPLWSLLGMDDGITMRVTQRRSLENLGRDPTRTKGVACARDMNEWKILNPTPTP
ncbi:MAG: pilus assembly protein [Chloroflexales bacterium]|nr:pilus assembly protein [Chloroflexales bacterium]